MTLPKLYLGAVTKNTIDVAIAAFNDGLDLGLIPSRRQIESEALGSGYCAGWSTEKLSQYVKMCTTQVKKQLIIERDHAGPNQGLDHDNGWQSIIADINSGYPIIHIDPWKIASSISEAVNLTSTLILKCEDYSYTRGKTVRYEVGTESAIYPYTPSDLYQFLAAVRHEVGAPAFDKIVYAVIQSGTEVIDLKNVGDFSSDTSSRFVNVCNSFGLTPKEHNSDFLTLKDFNLRVKSGVQTYNIAPEFGTIDSRSVRESLVNQKRHDIVEKLEDFCFKSMKWKKWVTHSVTVDPSLAYDISFHYHMNDPWVLEILSTADTYEILENSRRNIKNRLYDVYNEITKT